MNPFSYATELLALALALYLYDSSVLLYANEALLSASGGRFELQLPLAGFLLAGRSLCLSNPFTPHRAVFRLAFSFERLNTERIKPEWTERAAALASLKYPALIAWVALFVLLPTALFTPLSLYALIPAAVLLYGAAGYGLWRVHALREALHMTRPGYAAFAVECLLCPPFAVNMVRRLSLAQRIEESLPSAGARLLPPEQWQRLRAHCAQRLEGEMQVLEPGSEARHRLEASLRALQSFAVQP